MKLKDTDRKVLILHLLSVHLYLYTCLYITHTHKLGFAKNIKRGIDHIGDCL